MWCGHHNRLQKRLSNRHRPTRRCPCFRCCLSYIRSWQKCWPLWCCVITSCTGPTITVLTELDTVEAATVLVPGCCWLRKIAPETVWLAPLRPKGTACTESDNKPMLSSIVLNFCATLSSKNFNRWHHGGHLSVQSRLYSLLTIPHFGLQWPHVMLNSLIQTIEPGIKVSEPDINLIEPGLKSTEDFYHSLLTGSCPFWDYTWYDIPSAPCWHSATVFQPPKEHHCQGLPQLISWWAINLPKYNHVYLHSKDHLIRTQNSHDKEEQTPPKKAFNEVLAALSITV